ncbi:MAG: class I SAM-dependent methyltransferase [Acidobacteriota bacterium]|nr:class I SAM-dependent methyltransferase [Acidobacteriota bacterium]
MGPFTRPFQASIVARGVDQVVLLGAGLDTFAQRRADLAARMTIFEVDRPGPQAWKRQRLLDLGYGLPDGLRLVPVDFEAGDGETPFLSFFEPPELVALARAAGFREARHVSSGTLARRYFAGRPDGLRPPDPADELLVART